MNFVEVLLIGIGLAMDAFAVSIGKGLSMKKMNWKKAIIVGLYFGIFQGLMPIIGFFLGYSFESLVSQIDHWIAFFLLVAIGMNMIRETLKKDEENRNDSVAFKIMIILAIATSIDALTIGITFAFLQVNILTSALIIGVTTFLISVLGVKIGNKFGSKYESKSEVIGGLILILMGLKILLEHLNVFKF